MPYVIKPKKIEELIKLINLLYDGPLTDADMWSFFDETQLTEEEQEYLFRHRT